MAKIIRIYSLLLILLFISSCKTDDPFPADFIYEYIPSTNECIEYKIISKNPLLVNDGRPISIEGCKPSIMGFNSEDAAEVFSWIRRQQKNAN